MAATTSSPLRLQLPGGNITPPEIGDLSLEHCVADACSELLEEVGIRLETTAMKLWRIKTGGAHGDVGLIFEAMSQLSTDQLDHEFAAHRDTLLSRGETPELERLVVVAPEDFRAHGLYMVDYLPAVVDALAQEIR